MRRKNRDGRLPFRVHVPPGNTNPRRLRAPPIELPPDERDIPTLPKQLRWIANCDQSQAIPRPHSGTDALRGFVGHPLLQFRAFSLLLKNISSTRLCFLVFHLRRRTWRHYFLYVNISVAIGQSECNLPRRNLTLQPRCLADNRRRCDPRCLFVAGQRRSGEGF